MHHSDTTVERDIAQSFDYHGFEEMPAEDAQWIKQTFRDISSSRVELRAALWAMGWYASEEESLYGNLTESSGSRLYKIIRHPNLPNHPKIEIENLADGGYGGDLSSDVAVYNKQFSGQCYVCDRRSDTFQELQLQEHHTSYNPERTVLLCSKCHGRVHHRDGFFDDLEPSRSRDWLRYEHDRDSGVQVEFDAFS